MVGNISRIGNYIILETLGKGGFAKVFKCQDDNDKNIYAIKVETIHLKCGTRLCFDKPPSGSYYTNEWEIYKELQFGATKQSKEVGIPRIYERGVVKFEHDDKPIFHPFLVMQLFGKNIAQLTIRDGVIKGVTVGEFICIARQMLRTIQYIHNKKITHRDIKPQNFCLGRPGSSDENKVFIIDMGFAKKLPQKKEKLTDTFVGTPDYASISSLKGFYQGYKDDLEAICYTLIELWLGDLPWNVQQDISYDSDGWSKEQLFRMAVKRTSTWGLLYTLKLIPLPFFSWVKYCQSLDFMDEPDYGYFHHLISQFKDCKQDNIKDINDVLESLDSDPSQLTQISEILSSQQSNIDQNLQLSQLLSQSQNLSQNLIQNRKRLLSVTEKHHKQTINKKYQIQVEE